MSAPRDLPPLARLVASLRRLAPWLGRWPVALAAVFVLGVVLLLPGLGTPGLWEPHERQLADRAAPPLSVEKDTKKLATPEAEVDPDACLRAAPKDAKARTLTTRAARWGRDLTDSDTGRRLPFALMGLLTALATAGIAMRFAGARAGLLAGIVVLSMPLLGLQARMLTSEIGTACGSTLLIYGFVALSRISERTTTRLAVLDAVLAVLALLVGRWLGFYGGGMLLGVIVPIGAVAAAGGLGVPAVKAAINRDRVVPQLPAVGATLLVIGLLALLAHQLYKLETPAPGMTAGARVLFGKAIVAEGCWSSWLGATWNANDDVRMVFDSTFEQIAYGTFPWGILGPIAMAALLREEDRNLRGAGAIALAWAGAAWIASEVFQRKVGFTIFAGFPALAIAVGVWLDLVLARRAKGDPSAMPAGMMLVGLFFLIAVVNFGKDMHSFADRITSLLIGGDQIAYPKDARLLFLPTKTWILVIGGASAFAFALSMIMWRDGTTPTRRALQRFSTRAIAVCITGTVVMAGFWTFVWQPRLAFNLSSKGMFETYRELRAPGDALVIMGDLGNAPTAYADAVPEMVTSRDQIVKALGRPERVFAIAPQTELCALHREVGGKPYYVVDDRNVRNLLLSNKLDGTTDKNPLASAIVHSEPPNIPQRPKKRVVFDNKIELLGWSVPATMSRGSKVEIKLYYKILASVGGAWTSLMHFDGPLRFNGDHKPIKDRCPTSTWQPGDYIIDSHTVTAGGGAFPSARYEMWIGFFTGSNPNFKNMPVSEAPAEMRDTADRVKIMSVLLD